MEEFKGNANNNKLLHRVNNTFVPYKTEFLNPEDLQEILELQQLVYSSIKDKSWCFRLSEDEFLSLLKGRGLLIGARAENKLIAFYGVLFPGSDPENLGHDLNLPPEELIYVCHLEIAYVHPDFRGNGLQRLLGKALISAARQQREIRYLCGTVEPHNIIALENALYFGLKIVGLKEKYAGLRRFILLCDFTEDNKNIKEEKKMINYTDTIGHRELLDKGFRGIGVVRKNGESYIEYNRGL